MSPTETSKDLTMTSRKRREKEKENDLKSFFGKNGKVLLLMFFQRVGRGAGTVTERKGKTIHFLLKITF